MLAFADRDVAAWRCELMPELALAVWIPPNAAPSNDAFPVVMEPVAPSPPLFETGAPVTVPLSVWVDTAL